MAGEHRLASVHPLPLMSALSSVGNVHQGKGRRLPGSKVAAAGLGVNRGTSVVLSIGYGLSNSKDILESVLNLHDQSIHQADKQRL